MSEKTVTRKQETVTQAKRTKREKPVKAGNLPFIKDMLTSFEELLDKIQDDQKVAIFTHDTPDPDALASAKGLSFLFSQFGVQSKIFYGGYISHPQNRAMINIFDLGLQKVDDFDPVEYTLTVLVDTSNTKGRSSVRSINTLSITPDIIIDHHSDPVNPGTPVVLKERVGACSTLVTLMLDYYNLLSEEFTSEEIEVATALMIGLKTDTKDLTTNITSFDEKAFSLLIPRQENSKITSIIKYPLPEDLFRAKAFAYSNGNYYRSGSLVVSGTGFIREEHKDFNTIISDELIRGDGIEKVVVLGIVDNKAITASVRTTQVTTDTKEFCHNIFGPEFSGAKRGEGGAYIELSGDYKELLNSADNVNKYHIWQVMFNTWVSKIDRENTKS